MKESHIKNIEFLKQSLSLSDLQFGELVLDMAEDFVYHMTLDKDLARTIFLSKDFWRKWEFHFHHANSFFISRHNLRGMLHAPSYESSQDLLLKFKALHSPEKVKIEFSPELLEEAEIRCIERKYLEGLRNNKSRKLDPL